MRGLKGGGEGGMRALRGGEKVRGLQAVAATAGLQQWQFHHALTCTGQGAVAAAPARPLAGGSGSCGR